MRDAARPSVQDENPKYQGASKTRGSRRMQHANIATVHGARHPADADVSAPSRPVLKMRNAIRLQTERLLLREWRASDRAPFSRMNADPRVTEFLPSTLSRAESDALAERIEAHFRERGFGLYAAELRKELRDEARGDKCASTGQFIGWIGLSVPGFEAHFTPCVEIGWRLAADYWGRGLATEGAHEVAKHAFGELAFDELVSFTVAANVRSTRVMQKLGMTHNPTDDFDHPLLPPGHPLGRHVLYRLRHDEMARLRGHDRPL
jgi:ribosomal-protein-alanine N-acetyltransferase